MTIGIAMRSSRLLSVLLAAGVSVGCTATSTTSPSSATPDTSQSAMPTSSPNVASEWPSASPVAGAEPPRITWSEVPFDGSITAVVGDRTRFVAVGQGSEGTAAWTSGDGLTWEEHPVPDRSIAEPTPDITVDASMGQLVRLGDTLYSFGGGSFIDNVTLVVWRWTDGSAWELIESASDFYNGGFVWAVGASDDALVASLTVPYGSPNTWLWTADTSWAMTGLVSSAGMANWVADFAWAGGTYVAAGSTAEGSQDVAAYEWPRTPSIWTSSNGMEWNTATVPADATGFCAVSALAGGGFVALGSDGDGPASWTSMDGASWAEGSVEGPAGIELPALESPYAPCQIVTVGGGLVAAVGTPGGTMATWSSTDGHDWILTEPLPANGAIASLGDQLVLVGGVPDLDVEGGVRQVMYRGSVEP